MRLPSVSPAVSYAIRFAVAVSAAIALGHAPGLVDNMSQWILITVLMVSQPTSGGSLLKGLLRVAGTAAAVFTSIVLFGAFSQDPPLLMAGLFLVQVAAAYGFTGSRYQYAWFVWAFTTAIILGDALAGSGEVETLAFQRASMVMLGLLIVFAVDSLLWPSRAEPSLRASLAARARALAVGLHRVIALAPLTRASGAAGSDPAALVSQLGLIGAASSEIGVSPVRMNAMRHAALLLEGLASSQRVLADHPGDQPRPEILDALGALGSEVEAALEEIASAFESRRHPAAFVDRLGSCLLTLEARFEEYAHGGSAELHARGRLAELRDVVTHLRTLAGLQGHPAEIPGVESLASPPTGWLRADPLRVHRALRTGIAVIAALLVPMVLGWDMNAMVAPVAFMISAEGTRGGVVQSLVGVGAIVLLSWLVADLALVFYGPHVGRFPLALGFPFALAGLFAYVAAVRPQLALLPSVGGLVALLPVMSGMSAPTDVYGTYDAVCYVFLALAVGWAATRILWPATASFLFRRRAATQVEFCLEGFRRDEPGSDGTQQGSRLVGLISGYTAQLAQIAPLHAQADHEPVEAALDGPRRRSLLTGIQDLFDASLGAREVVPIDELPLLRRSPIFESLRSALQRVDAALAASMRDVAGALRGEARGPTPELEAAYADARARFEDLRVRDLGDPGERAVALEGLDAHRRLVTRQLALEAWLADWASARAPIGR